MSASLALNYAVASDRGLVRGNNEDSAYAGPHLLALADGMGGHAAGEVASQIMISHMRRLDVASDDLDMLAVLGVVADEGNRAIAAQVRAHPDTDGMGTTLSALMFDGHEFALCHVGDSRGYRLREGKLEQITKDDTFVQSLVDQGELDPEDVSTHPQRSLILKAYTGRPVEPTLSTLDARPGDRLLLCSDGLSDPVTASTIETTLSEGTPAQAARRLVELALRSGGPDNVTVVVADLIDVAANEKALAAGQPATAAGPGQLPVELPTQPVTAGALNAGEPEDPRPDTAAGRAAIMAAQATNDSAAARPANFPQVGAPRGEKTPTPGGPESEENPARSSAAAQEHNAGIQSAGSDTADTTAPRSSRRRVWIAALSTVVVVSLIAIGCVVGLKQADKHYFLAVDSDNRIVVEQGANYTVFGRSLHHTALAACLGESTDVTTVAVGADQSVDEAIGDACSPFTVDDLPPAVRNTVSTVPGGSLDQMVERLGSLARSALPVCVTREAADGSTPTATTTPTSTAASASPSASSTAIASSAASASASGSAAATTTEPRSSEDSRGSTNSAEDLDAPGVSCRVVTSHGVKSSDVASRDVASHSSTPSATKAGE